MIISDKPLNFNLRINMPKFFDKNELTQMQLNRWDYAMSEYTRITDDIRSKLPELDDSDVCTRALFDFMSPSQPGHEKSALFSRILNGQEALPYPPPLSFSYPWYELIDNKNEHPVQIGFFPNNPNQILINQCVWQVDHSNLDVLLLYELFAKVTAGDFDCDPIDVEKYQTEPSIDLLAKKAKQIKFHVKYSDDWPPFLISMGRVMRSCNLDYYRGSPPSKIDDDLSGGNSILTGDTGIFGFSEYQCDGWVINQL